MAIEMSFSIDLPPRLFKALLYGSPLDDKSEPEMTWEDDGGALVVRCEGYEHTIGPAPE